MQQAGQGSLYLLPDSCRAGCGNDCQLCALDNLSRVVSQDELQFGAADFKAEMGHERDT